jgi:hypothetical protein
MQARAVRRATNQQCDWFHQAPREKTKAWKPNVRLGQDAEPVVRHEEPWRVEGKYAQHFVSHSAAVSNMLDDRVGCCSVENIAPERQGLRVRTDEGRINSFFGQTPSAHDEPPERDIDPDYYRVGP